MLLKDLCSNSDFPTYRPPGNEGLFGFNDANFRGLDILFERLLVKNVGPSDSLQGDLPVISFIDLISIRKFTPLPSPWYLCGTYPDSILALFLLFAKNSL